MRRLSGTISLLFLLLALLPAPGWAWTRTEAKTFATLPPGATGPEGITVDGHENVYVTTFGFTTTGPVSGPGQLYVFNRSGKLQRQVSVAGSTAQLLGLAFHPTTGALLVIDFGSAQVLKVDPTTGASSLFMTPPVSGAGLNALAFDKAGNVYVSDSFLGTIWRTGPRGGAVTAWVKDPTLTTTGVPPFGANGLAFNQARTALFVSNTGNDTVVKIPVLSNGRAGTPGVFVNSVNGADGLIIDEDDNVWVAANQADEIVVIDPTGRVIAKLGDFGGIDDDGAAIGLLFPASLVFSNSNIYITNLALDLRLFGLAQAVDSQWTSQVVRYTISKISASIPPVRGLP